MELVCASNMFVKAIDVVFVFILELPIHKINRLTATITSTMIHSHKFCWNERIAQSMPNHIDVTPHPSLQSKDSKKLLLGNPERKGNCHRGKINKIYLGNAPPIHSTFLDCRRT